MADLQDVEEILEGGRLHRPVDREVLATAIQALLFHQVIYEDLDRIGHRAYDALKAHRGFFERYFAAMGYRFVHSAREQMFALVADGPQYGSAKARLKKDETLIMLALRLLLENGMRAGTMDGLGRVPATTDDLHDSLRMIASSEAPSEGRLDEILKDLQRHGGVSLGEKDTAEKNRPLTVLPGIAVLVSDSFVEKVITWLEAGGLGADGDGDVLAFVAQTDSSATTAPLAAPETQAAEPAADMEG